MRYPVFKVIVYLFAVTVIGLLFLEFALRVLAPDKKEAVVPASIGRLDPELGWALKPQACDVSNRIGYPIEYCVNSNGLRDDETPYAKTDGIFRIAVVGDSRTFGYGVPIEKHFTRLLEGYLKDVEVINLGVSGYGADQELLILRSEGFRYQPDIVLAYVAHYSGDRHMYTKRFGKQKPKFILENNQLVLTNYPLYPVEEGADDRTKSLVSRLKQALLMHSRVAQIAYSAYVRFSKRDMPKVDRSQREGGLVQESYPSEAVVDMGGRIIAAMDSESKAHGADFVLVTGYDVIRDSMRDRGIKTLDVRLALGNPMFSLPDNLAHKNESGNGVLAWEIAKYLTDSGLLPERHWGYYAPGPMKEPVTN